MTSQANVVTSQVQAMTTQVNREIGPRVPQHASTMVSRLRDFTKMNPPMFYGSWEDKDLQYLPDEVYKILFAMAVTKCEKPELASYKLKDLVQTWYTKSIDIKVLRGCQVTVKIYKRGFLDRLFPTELREAKVE